MKKIILFIISFFLCINKICAIELDINSKNAFVYNLTEDRIMYEKDAYKETRVASLTKIMTAIIVIENNDDLNTLVKIKDEDLRDMYEYTTIGLQEGYEVSIKDLLYGILVKSGSDAVNAAVRATTKTEEEFVNLMNQKVRELGLTHTNFSNPVGKDKDNYSNAYDITKIMEYCLKNKTFKEIISTDYYIIDNLDIEFGGPLHLSESKYGIDTSIINGSKSGYTKEAEFSLVSYSEKDGVTYIITTLHNSGYTSLLSDNSYLYQYFFNNYSYKDYNINFDIPIKNGKTDNYNVNLDTKLYLENNIDPTLITYKYSGKNEINILIPKNSTLGKVSVYYDSDLIKTFNVTLNKDIEYNAKVYIKIGTIIFVVIGIILFVIFLKWQKKIIKKIKKIRKKKRTSKLNKEQKKMDKLALKTTTAATKLIKEENSLEKKLKIIKSTTNINLFFDTLKSVNYTSSDKEKFEKDFIDRSFQKINFKSLSDLQDLYTKLKLYKREMSKETIKYYNKLFKYCTDNYISKDLIDKK